MPGTWGVGIIGQLISDRLFFGASFRAPARAAFRSAFHVAFRPAFGAIISHSRQLDEPLGGAFDQHSLTRARLGSGFLAGLWLRSDTLPVNRRISRLRPRRGRVTCRQGGQTLEARGASGGCFSVLWSPIGRCHAAWVLPSHTRTSDGLGATPGRARSRYRGFGVFALVLVPRWPVRRTATTCRSPPPFRNLVFPETCIPRASAGRSPWARPSGAAAADLWPSVRSAPAARSEPFCPDWGALRERSARLPGLAFSARFLAMARNDRCDLPMHGGRDLNAGIGQFSEGWKPSRDRAPVSARERVRVFVPAIAVVRLDPTQLDLGP
jgi:hypothetical protein